jgi:hypothetical protein
MNATNEVEYDGSEKKDVDIVTNEELTSQHAIQDAIETGDNACVPSPLPPHSTAKANDGVQRSGKTAPEATGVVLSCLMMTTVSHVCLSVFMDDRDRHNLNRFLCVTNYRTLFSANHVFLESFNDAIFG